MEWPFGSRTGQSQDTHYPAGRGPLGEADEYSLYSSPITTDPTPAGVGSLLAEEKGCLREYIIKVTDTEWGQGVDIGQPDTLIELAREVGLDPVEFEAALNDPDKQKILADNWHEAQEAGVIGVPTLL